MKCTYPTCVNEADKDGYCLHHYPDPHRDHSCCGFGLGQPYHAPGCDKAVRKGNDR